MTKDIQGIQTDFLALMEEFSISRDIKGDFAEFSSRVMNNTIAQIEEKFLEVKNEITSQIQQKLISDFLCKVDDFDTEFQKI